MKHLAIAAALVALPALAWGQTYPFPNAPYAGEKGAGTPSTNDQILVQQGVTSHDPVGSPARMTLGTLQGLIGGLPLSGGTLTGAITVPGVTNSGSETVAGTLGVTGAASFGATTIAGGQNVTTSGGGGFISNSGLGTITASNGLITTPLAWVGAGGTTTGSGTLAPVLKMTRNLAGSLTGTPVFNDFNVPSDTADASGASNIPIIFRFIDNYGGANAKGGRTLVQTYLNINNSPGDTGQLNYVAQETRAIGSVSIGGTPGSHSGALWAQNIIASLNPGATNWISVIGSELDFGITTGASAGRLTGYEAVLEGTHAVQGTAGQDSGFLVVAQGAPSALLNYGYLIGTSDSAFPIASNGTAFGFYNQAVNGGSNKNAQLPQARLFAALDGSNVNYTLSSGYFLRGPGWSVAGDGTTNIGSGTLAPSTSGITISSPNYVVQGTPTVVSGGSASGNGLNNYYPTDIVNGPGNVTAGQYEVVTTKAVAAAVVAGGTGGADGACTVTGTTGTGTQFQASGTVTGGTLGGALTIAIAGSYTVNPPNLSAVPVTGCGLTGATLNVGMGAATVTVLVPDVNTTALAGTKAMTGGSGAGLTLSMASAKGVLMFAGLPTSCASQPSGTVWNNANALNVCP